MQVMSLKKKSLHEESAKFFENPTREGFRELLKNNFGELTNLEFKREWPTFPKVARHILGITNVGGGAIVVGVAELPDNTLEPIGLTTLVDKAEIEKGINKFLPEHLRSNLSILDFSYDASEYGKLVGKRFQVILIEDDPKYLPFVALASSDGIRETAIYVRRGTSTVEANHEELQRIINRRVDTGHSSQVEMDLETHIEQLNILFKHIEKHRILVKNSILYPMGENLVRNSLLYARETVNNKQYPKEDFESFIVRMIEKKKKRIEAELDVVGMP